MHKYVIMNNALYYTIIYYNNALYYNINNNAL